MYYHRQRYLLADSYLLVKHAANLSVEYPTSIESFLVDEFFGALSNLISR
jgi:hypothetical protein